MTPMGRPAGAPMPPGLLDVVRAVIGLALAVLAVVFVLVDDLDRSMVALLMLIVLLLLDRGGRR